jgi:hypothetical protein
MNAGHTTRRVTRGSFTARTILAVATAVVALLAVGKPASAAASWRWWNTDADVYYDAATLDADYNGFSEDNWYDLDNDARLDTRLWNSRGADNFLESLTFDLNEDGRPEIYLWDTDGRAGFDVVYFDNNGDGYYESSAYVSQNSYSSVGVVGGGSNSLINTVVTMRTTDGRPVFTCGFQYAYGQSCNF